MFGETNLGTASGFLVSRHDGSHLLITDWRIVTGRNLLTRKLLEEKHASIPDAVRIAHKEPL
jgi:hypothetical protein